MNLKSFTLLAVGSALSLTVKASQPPARIPLSPGVSSNATAVGAAYFMTNEPSGNYLVSATIGSDAKLTLYAATYTEGIGAHGVSPFADDALFSQGSVDVSPTKNFLANVNLNMEFTQSGSNTVSVYEIDAANPAILNLIGNPIASGGEFPISLVINQAGTRVCVLNGGQVNGVSCYIFDAKNGLTPIKNSIRSLGLNQTTPDTGPANTASQIIFSPDETQLIVSVKSGFLAVWDISSDGSLSSTFSTISGGVLPFSLIYVPGQNAIFASDPGVGYDIFNLNTNTAEAVTVPGQQLICWSVYSSQSGNFYLMDVGTSLVTEVHVSSSLTSSSVTQYSLGSDGPIDSAVATINKQEYAAVLDRRISHLTSLCSSFIYILAAGATGLNVLSVNGPGEATVYQRVDLVAPAQAAHLPLNGTFLQGMATYII
ncbi:hypothetical protein K438DRAFT_1784774 [Mycena galopus ATCC 62051]|nr:hypothetical protein K438DRAFT_1784774 [Mycena galopus ATCC 62051]